MIKPQSQPKTQKGFLDRVVFRNRTLLVMDIIVIIAAYFATFFLVYEDWGKAYDKLVSLPSLIVIGISIALFVGVMVIFMHRTNLYRLFNGTESKFSFHKKKAEPTEDKKDK